MGNILVIVAFPLVRHSGVASRAASGSRSRVVHGAGSGIVGPIFVHGVVGPRVFVPRVVGPGVVGRGVVVPGVVGFGIIRPRIVRLSSGALGRGTTPTTARALPASATTAFCVGMEG